MFIRLLRMRLLAVGFALASIVVSTATMAQRASCTASFNATTGALVVEAVAVGATTYLAKLSQASGAAMVFNLDSATVTNNACFDPASFDGGAVNIPSGPATRSPRWTATVWPIWATRIVPPIPPSSSPPAMD